MDLDDAYRLMIRLYDTPATGKGSASSPTSPMSAPHARPQHPNLGATAPATAPKFPSLGQVFVYIAFLLPSFVMAQFFTGGDLSQRAPYGLPTQHFAATIATPALSVNFAIPGYNVSIPPADRFAQATIDPIPGWSLTLGVTGNVPLAKASKAAPVDKNSYVAAAGLSITPPTNVPEHNTTGWRLCAVIFTASLSSFAVDRAKIATVNDGTCSGIFPDACIRRLQLTSMTRKWDQDASCQDLSVPFECAAYFAGDRGTGFEISPIGLSQPPDRRSMFFSAALEPARKGNWSALAVAQRRVWPVLLAWTCFNHSGLVQDSAGWLSCATTGESKKPPRGKVRSVLDPEDPTVNKSRAALLVWLLIASVIWLGHGDCRH